MITKPRGGKMEAMRDVLRGLKRGDEVDVTDLVDPSCGNLHRAAKDVAVKFYTRRVDGRVLVRLR